VLAVRVGRCASMEATLRALGPRGRFCLDGLRGHPEGRWAFLGAEPEEVRRVDVGAPDPLGVLGAIEPAPPARWASEAPPLSAAAVPRWVGMLSYDAAWSDPRALGLRIAPRHRREGWPAVWLGRYEALLAVDQERGETWAIGTDDARVQRLAAAARAVTAEPRARVGEPIVEPPAVHRARIECALEAIAAGRIYQVNLARPWRAAYEGDPLALFAAMRDASPVPLGAYLELEGGAIVCRTMERFLRWDRASRELWTSPIKGTIARTGADDDGEARRLRSDDKERAEHSMIVDLMRNDLSRVAEVGSVRVIDPLRVEPFAGLSHLVSTVSCVTRPGVDLADVLRATFPPGSVTGTPKLAAMELIEQQEATARGPYTGALGYVDRGGGLSLAVAIRAAAVRAGEVTYFAGGGLVSASDPGREIEETELKARVFLDAIRRLNENNLD